MSEHSGPDTGEAMKLETLVRELEGVFGGALRCVVLYGSAAGAEVVERRSDYNVLVIVDALPLERLEEGGAHLRSWVDGGNPSPLVLTSAEWRSSADVFPMEYADILAQHRVLHGEFVTAGLRVDPGHLRLAVEREAMGKLLQLRRGVLAAGGDAQRRAELLAVSLSTFLAIFRGALRVHGEEPPPESAAVCRRVATLASFDGEPFVKVMAHRKGGAALASGEVHEVLDGYLRGVARLVAHLDALDPEHALGVAVETG